MRQRGAGVNTLGRAVSGKRFLVCRSKPPQAGNRAVASAFGPGRSGETFGSRAPSAGQGRGGHWLSRSARSVPLEAFLVSLGAVAVAEIGDKTQLLALILAIRFRAPVSVIAGIFVATVFNHALAAWFGILIADWLTPEILAWGLGVSFLAMGVWALIPDTPPSEGESAAAARFGPFLATAIAFFLVEMGDKTQIATAALAARYQSLALVALGTTLGMMVANVPVVLLGEAAAKFVPLSVVRTITAVIFVALGAFALAGALAHVY